MTTETTPAPVADPAALAAAAIPNPQPSPASATAPAPAAGDVASLQAQLEKERQERRAANAEAQKHRKAVREIQEKGLLEAGKFKELAEARAKEIETRDQELEQLRGKVSTFEQREAEAQKQRETQVNAEFSALPEEARADVPADADLRTKEFAVRMYQRLSGKKPTPAPAVAPTAPVPAPAVAAGARPPRPSDVEMQKYAVTRDQNEKASLGAKIRAWTAWTQQHPGES